MRSRPSFIVAANPHGTRRYPRLSNWPWASADCPSGSDIAVRQGPALPVWVGHSCPTRARTVHVGRTFLSDKGQHCLVPGGGVEPPRYQVPADFESAASASSAIPAREGTLRVAQRISDKKWPSTWG